MALPRDVVVELARLYGPDLEDGWGRSRLLQAIANSHPHLADEGVSRTDLDRIQGAWDMAVGSAIMGVETTDDGMSYTVTGPLVKDYDEMIAHLGIDTTDFIVQRGKGKTWTTTTGDGRQYPNWHREVTFERRPLVRLLEPRFELPKLPRVERPSFTDEYLTVLIPDAQIGFRWMDRWTYADPIHDRVALDVILQFVKANADRVTRIVWGGDNLDLAELSLKFSKTMDPALRDTTDISVLEFRYWLRQFRLAAPGAFMDVLPGNHDKRWQDFVTANASPLARFVALEDVLRLDEVDAVYHGPYGESVQVSPHSCATHGDFHGSTAAEKHLAQVSKNNIWYFHNHREQVADRRTREGKALWARCPGFVARTDAGVVPAGKHHTEYFQGFGIEVGDSERAFPAVVKIVDGQAMIGTERFVGQDHARAVAEWTGVRQMVRDA